MDSQDGGLGRVDDGCTHHGAEHAAIRDGKRASIHVFDGKFVSSGLRQNRHHNKKEKMVHMIKDAAQLGGGNK